MVSDRGGEARGKEQTLRLITDTWTCLGTDWFPGPSKAICLLGSGCRPFWAIFFLLVLGTCFKTVLLILYSLCLDPTLFESSSILLVLRSSFEHFRFAIPL